MGGGAPVFSQDAYQFYEDGTEAASVALGTQDAALLRNVSSDSNVLLRTRLQNSGSAAGTGPFQLQRSIAGGAFADVTTSSTGAKSFDSASLTNGGATTQRLTAGSGTFSAGVISETGSGTVSVINTFYTELLYTLTLLAADLSNGQALTFRLLNNGATMTYNVTPTLNITKDGAALPNASPFLVGFGSLKSF